MRGSRSASVPVPLQFLPLTGASGCPAAAGVAAVVPPLHALQSVSSGVSTEVNSSDGCACRTCASVAHGAAIVTGRNDAVGVGGREQLRGRVVQPRQPEQVALLAGGVARVLLAVRVVAEQVEEVVEAQRTPASGSARRPRRCVETGRRSRTSGRDSRTNGRMLVAQLRRRLLGERAHRLVGGGERARRRAQLLGRRAEQLGERARRGRACRSSACSVLGSSLHGRGDVGLLLGERVEDGGGGVDEPREVVAVRGELALRGCSASVTRWRRLLAPRGDRAVDAREVAVRRLEAREQVAQVAAAPLRGPRPASLTSSCRYSRVSVSSTDEDLVRVDVRLRRADRDREAALGHRRVAAARLRGR